MPRIEDVIAEQGAPLMDIPGVTGVGQTEVEGRDCIVVMLTQSAPEIEKTIPATLGGYPVVFEVAGEIQAQRPQ